MRMLISAVAAGAVMLAGASFARAQHGHGHGGHGHGGFGHGYGHGGFGHGYGHGGFGHGYGHGGFGHGYGHGGFGHGYGNFYADVGHLHGHYHNHWYPSYGYYSYPSTYYPSYTYPSVVVSRPAVVDATAIIRASATSLKSNSMPAGTSEVTLRLPADYDVPVHVRIDHKDVELKPGNQIVLKNRAYYIVEFDRGGDFGKVRIDLTRGAYKLVAGAKGWQLIAENGASGDETLRKNVLPAPLPAKEK